MEQQIDALVQCDLDGLMRRRNLKQKDVSRITGIPQSTICSLQNNTRFPTRQTLSLLCRSLECHPADLLTMPPRK